MYRSDGAVSHCPHPGMRRAIGSRNWCDFIEPGDGRTRSGKPRQSRVQRTPHNVNALTCFIANAQLPLSGDLVELVDSTFPPRTIRPLFSPAGHF